MEKCSARMEALHHGNMIPPLMENRLYIEIFGAIAWLPH